MKLDEAIKNRRSIRVYNDNPITKEEILKLIEAANWAPTACNRQSFKFIVINNKKIFNKILDKGAATFLKKIDTAILVLYDNQIDNLEYMDYIQSASASIQNMLLKAYSMGIGACWICHLPTKSFLRKLLDIPFNYDPIALISLGHYDKDPRKMKRKKEAREIVSYNSFDFDEEIPSRFNIKLRLKRIARKIYFKLPKKKLLKKIVLKFEKKFDN
ncbi:nitroreductase family protein [Orenia marismortui]|uniref:nitroreductase family protein n=1 Tax=Orenia marismortui TaxID=46469 RepID=UPI000362DB54|nr:nitroreductase family protein [Orenia marismortui]